jgi:hypothetical protein
MSLPSSQFSPGRVEAPEGRLPSLSETERQARTEALRTVLAEIVEMTDESDTDEICDDVMWGIVRRFIVR